MNHSLSILLAAVLLSACGATTPTADLYVAQPTAVAATVSPLATATAIPPLPTSPPEPTPPPEPQPQPTPLPAPTATPVPSATPTAIPLDDLQGGISLVGRHGLTLQWISWQPEEWGAVQFDALGNETYRVSGRQDGLGGDYVAIDGRVTMVSPAELRFDGTIEVRISYNNDGDTCVREGEQTFLSTVGRRFWRLQDLLNCDGIVTDYVDIYFG